jgi:hypothetical protein
LQYINKTNGILRKGPVKWYEFQRKALKIPGVIKMARPFHLIALLQ